MQQTSTRGEGCDQDRQQRYWSRCLVAALSVTALFQSSVEPFAYHTDFTVIIANVQAAARDILVRAVVFVTSLLHCLRHDFFLRFNFFEIVTCP